MKNIVKSNVIFHSTATESSTGHIYQTRFNPLIINIEVFGDATEFELVFEGISNHEWEELMGVNLGTLDYAASVNSFSGIWQVQLVGISEFRANLKSVAGGTVSVKGKAVG